MADIKKLTEQQAKLQKQLNNKRNQINALKKKIEKDRVHKMCEVAGFLFTEIAGGKGENYNDYQNLDLENFKNYCWQNKDVISKALKGDTSVIKPNEQASNSPISTSLNQERVNSQQNNNQPIQSQYNSQEKDFNYR